ncbi:MAG: hypothetical protein ABIU54_07630 [Candidatus Eisenbacteria bacterium]
MIPAPTSTALRLTGRDVLTVLHRVSTQKLDDLAIGECRTTLLCDFRGRMQHRFVVARMRDEGIWLVRPDAAGSELAEAIDRSVFREEVTIEDRSVQLPVTAVRVNTPSATPQRLLPSGDPTVPGLVHEDPSVAFVIGGAGEREALSPGHGVLDDITAIAQGWARQSHEIIEEFNPFEVGLGKAVHLDKGCFTGQETLQRLITYSSVRRQLVILQGAVTHPSCPSQILSLGQDAGRLTSASPSQHGWSGLAVMRRASLESGASFELADGQVVTIARTFEPARPLGRP